MKEVLKFWELNENKNSRQQTSETYNKPTLEKIRKKKPQMNNLLQFKNLAKQE